MPSNATASSVLKSAPAVKPVAPTSEDAAPAQPGKGKAKAKPGAAPNDALFKAYVDACKSCGQDVKGLTPEKLEGILEKQRAQLRTKFGDTAFTFRVAVEDGKAKLKATKAKAAS